MTVEPTQEPDPEDRPSLDPGAVEQITNVVLARIEQHLHLPMPVPDAQQAAALREQAPELYGAWIRMLEAQGQADIYMQTAEYKVPEQLARRGQPYGLAALSAVLLFCGFLSYTSGTTGDVIAGVLATLDVVAIIGTFMATRHGPPQQ